MWRRAVPPAVPGRVYTAFDADGLVPRRRVLVPAGRAFLGRPDLPRFYPLPHRAGDWIPVLVFGETGLTADEKARALLY